MLSNLYTTVNCIHAGLYRCTFAFVPHLWPKAPDPLEGGHWYRSYSSVSPQHVAKKEIDRAIRTTFRNPPILASERRAQYEDLKRLVLSEIKPRGLHEALLARDIVEAEWEVYRLRWMKLATLHAARGKCELPHIEARKKWCIVQLSSTRHRGCKCASVSPS
jgi:hypothetical protein